MREKLFGSASTAWVSYAADHLKVFAPGIEAVAKICTGSGPLPPHWGMSPYLSSRLNMWVGKQDG